MLRGERAAFKIDPEYSYAEKGSSFQPPAGMSPDASLVLDIQLVNWYPKKHVKSLGEDGVILRTIQASESWEHPRPPFEVSSCALCFKYSCSPPEHSLIGQIGPSQLHEGAPLHSCLYSECGDGVQGRSSCMRTHQER